MWSGRPSRSYCLQGLILAVGLCLSTAPAHAFRCGNELVLEGDRKYDVLRKCGEPDFRERGAAGYLGGLGPIGVTETWYYNPGSSGLIRVLTFHQGRLRSIATGGRGFSTQGPAGPCQPHELDIGMSKYELLNRCGQPAARDSWFEYGGAGYRDHPFPGTVLVEEWVYTFGSNRFRRYVRIVNGRVVGIESGGKGG